MATTISRIRAMSINYALSTAIILAICGQFQSHQIIIGTGTQSFLCSFNNSGYVLTHIEAHDPFFQHKHSEADRNLWAEMFSNYPAASHSFRIYFHHRHPQFHVWHVGVTHIFVITCLSLMLLVQKGTLLIQNHRRCKSCAAAPADFDPATTIA